MVAAAPPKTAPPVAPYKVEVFFDGECPLCRKEINFLRWLDRKGRVRFTDIATAGFEASVYDKTQGELMAEIHGRDASGAWVVGVEVFRQLYAAIGLGFVVPVTRLPGVRHGLDAAYRFFAKRRLWLTGRCADGVCAVENAVEKPETQRPAT